MEDDGEGAGKRGGGWEKEDIVSITMLVMLPVESGVRGEYQISRG